MTRTDVDARWELALEQYRHVEQQAALAANKASLLAAAGAIMVGAFVSVAKDCPELFDPRAQASAFGALFAWSGALIVGGLLVALWSTKPRVTGNAAPRTWWDRVLDFPGSRWTPSRAGANPLFYVDIAGTTDAALYRAEFRALDTEGALDALLDQIHGKSDWLYGRFASVRYAVLLLMAGTVGALIAVYGLKLAHGDKPMCSAPPPAVTPTPTSR